MRPWPDSGVGNALRQIVAVAGGLAGGTVWWLLSLPLPWMVGSMVGGTLIGLLPMRPMVGRHWRSAMMIAVGIIVGSAVPANFLDAISGWHISLAMIAAYTVTVMIVGTLLLRRFAGYDAVSSYCMAAPGGFMEMVLIGTAMGADPNRIALVHSVRMLFVVLIVPPLMVTSGPEPGAGSMTGIAGGMAGGAGGEGAIGIQDVLVLAGCVAGALIGRRLRVPGALMVVPMMLTGTAYLTGLTDAHLPPWALVVAQVVVGTSMGCGIALLRPSTMLKALMFGTVLVSVFLVFSAGFAAALSMITGLPINLAFLLFAPGGAPEMSLIALSLGMEPAMVASHHIFRLLLVVSLAPVVGRMLRRRAEGGDPERAAP
ncbi:AbrB family transcriptional regulator [Fodinicurvata sp. EGI_FJ10296]|uniref:AbrB family transcriptional regulator n=1 Tax=Fodinicurvata sp. EGI_FJ10296 TaxID=3231908 RepID=UPI0034553E7C